MTRLVTPPQAAEETQTSPAPFSAPQEPAPFEEASRPGHALYSERQRWIFLAVLFLVATSNFMDRNIIAVLLEPIKKEFGISDTLLGLLSGVSFAVLYAVLGLPVARWADRGNRKTIMALALAIWSFMTVLCGMAQNVVQLAMARIGVGIGEAGAVPPGQSLIVDYFPPHQRARALAIFGSAASAGYILGFVLGAHIAATQGWRAAFILLGAPGLLLTFITWAVLREPRAVLGAPVVAKRESFFGTLKILWQKASYRYNLIGMTLYYVFAYGALIFVPSYLNRVLGVSMPDVGTWYGSVSAVAALVGTIGGGWLADRLALRDQRWLLRLPALGVVLACPIYLAIFNVQQFSTFLILVGVGATLLCGALPAAYAGSHLVCGSSRRSMSVAIQLFFITMIGNTLGPLATGLLSDAFAVHSATTALRYALTIVTLILFASSWALYRGSLTLQDEIET